MNYSFCVFQVLRLCWLYTPENFTYYDSLLSDLLRKRYPAKSLSKFVPSAAVLEREWVPLLSACRASINDCAGARYPTN